MRVTPFRLIADRELRNLEVLLAPVISDWCRRWLDVDGGLRLVEATRAEDRGETKGELWGECERGVCVLRLTPSVRKKWIGSMLRSHLTFDRETELGMELWSHSLRDLMNSVLAALIKGGEGVGLPERVPRISPEWIRAGSGIVGMRLAGEIGATELLLPLSGSLVQDPVGPKPEVDREKRNAALQKALGNQTLTAEMVLSSGELSLGDLMDLQVGDVIAMDQRVDETLSLRIKGTSVVVNGYLGKRQGSKALVVSNANQEGENN